MSIEFQNNGPVLLLKTISRHWNCFLLSVATDGKDGHGLKLENWKAVWPTFSSFNAMPAKSTKKLLWFLPSDEICLISSS